VHDLGLTLFDKGLLKIDQVHVERSVYRDFLAFWHKDGRCLAPEVVLGHAGNTIVDLDHDLVFAVLLLIAEEEATTKQLLAFTGLDQLILKLT
jgi:hypothetical protein